MIVQWNYYIAMRNSELQPHLTTWMRLTHIVLNQRGQTQAKTCHMIPLMWCPRPDQIHPRCRSQARACLWKGQWGLEKATRRGPGELVMFYFSICELDGWTCSHHDK